MKKKLTRFDLQKMKDDGRKAVWITAYDYITAQLAEEAGMDMLLVGDSLGMAVYGYSHPGSSSATPISLMNTAKFSVLTSTTSAPELFRMSRMSTG